MLKIIAALSLVASMNAYASELDQDEVITNQGPQGTVIIRVDQRDGAVSMVKTDDVLSNAKQAHSLAEMAEFNTISAANLRNELDETAGSSSWYYVYTPYANYPYYNCLNWYGYNYYPYYNYSYGYYNYYYYGWHNRWWR